VENIQPEDNSSSVSVALSNPTHPTMVSTSTASDTTGTPVGHHTVEIILPEDNSSSVCVAPSNRTNPTMVSTSTASDMTGTPVGHHTVEIIQPEDNCSAVCVAPSNPTNPTMVSTSTVLDTIDSPIRRKIGHPTVEINKPEDYSFSVSVASNNHKPAMMESVLDSHLLQQLPPVLDGFVRSTVTLPKTMITTMHPYNKNVRRPASNKIITTCPTRKATLSHTQLLCLVAHALDPVDVPLFIAAVEAIKMTNGQFPNYVPLFVRSEINDLFGYPKKAPPPGPAPKMGSILIPEAPVPPKTAPTLGSEEVSVVVESEALL